MKYKKCCDATTTIKRKNKTNPKLNKVKRNTAVFMKGVLLAFLALRRWGRFGRRNICDSATEIPY